ncbi:uncharacterized protein LOC129595637 [Paramacrobiotus metropolitanus]|uniref:uncharacterized protein LOC129595637 n=1 Tax=Paramacrobiotus metropolitanus TaxID=2943436 RepID=UPI0024464562|nr:uncharacterized protein LOC129595637 [Paramacrobiotus metropolitanus]
MHFNDCFYAAVNDIGLNLTERYLLLTVGLFSPDVTQVSSNSKRKMECSYAYFLSVLFYLMGHRLSVDERETVYKKLEKIIRQFAKIDALCMKYVSSVNTSEAPLRPRSSLSFKECLSADAKKNKLLCVREKHFLYIRRIHTADTTSRNISTGANDKVRIKFCMYTGDYN